MKKLITMLLIVATLAAMTVNCFAVSTAVSDLDLIFFDDFEDKTKHDYENSENYIAEVADGKLYLMSMTGKKVTSYELPGAEPLSGVEKITAAYSFTIDVYGGTSNVNFTLGGKDPENYATMGLSTGNKSGGQTFYALIVNSSNSRPNPYNNNEKEATRTFSYLKKDAELQTPWNFEQGVTYTVIIELEKGGEPQFTYYADGNPIEHYAGPNAGKLKENGEKLKRDYLYAEDPEFTMDGNIGLSVTNAVAVLFDAVAVYKATGLDHKELIAKVNAGGSSAPAETEPTPVETDPAPVETDPAPVETDPAPVETDPTPVETDPAPVETDPTPVETDPTPVETDPAPAEGGCGGVIGVGALVAILGCAVVLKKKEN